MTDEIIPIKKEIEIFCVVMGATKKEGKRPIMSASRAETIIENRTTALKLYSEFVTIAENFKQDGWTSGKVSMFRPMITKSGHIVLVPQGKPVCEYTFGIKEDEDAANKKTM